PPAAWWRFFRTGATEASVITGVSRTELLRRHFQGIWGDLIVASAVQRWRIWAALGLLAGAAPFVRQMARGRTAIEVAVSIALLYGALDSARYLAEYDKRFVFFDVARFYFGWLVIVALTALAVRTRREEDPDRFARRSHLRARIVVSMLLFALPFAT